MPATSGMSAGSSSSHDEKAAWEIRLIATMQMVIDGFATSHGIGDLSFKELPVKPPLRYRRFQIAGKCGQETDRTLEISVNYLAQLIIYFSPDQWKSASMNADARELARSLADHVECTSVLAFVPTADRRIISYPWIELVRLRAKHAKRAAEIAKRYVLY